MATNFSTVGGVVTRGETLAKLQHHIREAEDQAYIMSHLENTEGGTGTLLAKGWLGVGEMLKLMHKQITDMAMKGLQ